MCDYYSNYRARRPQLAQCFSTVSFLINTALVITGSMRVFFKAFEGPHSKLLTPYMSYSPIPSTVPIALSESGGHFPFSLSRRTFLCLHLLSLQQGWLSKHYSHTAMDVRVTERERERKRAKEREIYKMRERPV